MDIALPGPNPLIDSVFGGAPGYVLALFGNGLGHASQQASQPSSQPTTQSTYRNVPCTRFTILQFKTIKNIVFFENRHVGDGMWFCCARARPQQNHFPSPVSSLPPPLPSPPYPPRPCLFLALQSHPASTCSAPRHSINYTRRHKKL